MLEFESLTIPCMIKRSIKNFGEHPALGFLDEPMLSYHELGEKIQQVQSLLREAKVEKGDRVAILGENSPNWGISYLAVTTMGAIVVPILPNFHEAEVLHILRSSGAKVLFISQRLAKKVENPNVGQLNLVISLEDFSIKSADQKSDVIGDFIRKGLADLSKLRKAAKERIHSCDEDIQEDDLAAIIYTSGTTGHSKGVMLTHKNLISNIRSLSGIITLYPGDRLLSILPLSHTFECTIGFLVPLAFGASVHYLKELPSAANLIPALKKVQPTYIASVPLIMEKIYKKRVLGEINKKSITRALYKISLFRKLLNRIAGRKLYQTFGGKLKLIVFGGAPLSPDVERFLIEAKFPYTCGYGLTETSPLLTGSVDEVRFQSPGRPVPDVEIKIVDPDPETGIGEIYARGPNIMRGYYKDPERTAEVLSPEGWFKTGDRGYLDEDGYLFIKGRSKNLLLGPSGENIYPEEIEQHLNESEFVLESLVYQKGNRIIARVHLDYELLDQLFRTEKMNESQIRDRIQKLLTDLKRDVNRKVSDFSRIHEIIEQPEPFEKTPTQKIKRYLYTEGES